MSTMGMSVNTLKELKNLESKVRASGSIHGPGVNQPSCWKDVWLAICTSVSSSENRKVNELIIEISVCSAWMQGAQHLTLVHS